MLERYVRQIHRRPESPMLRLVQSLTSRRPTPSIIVLAFIVFLWYSTTHFISLINTPTPLTSSKSSYVWATRAGIVREAFRHAYEGYRENATGHDELLPISGGFVDKYVHVNLLLFKENGVSIWRVFVVSMDGE